MDGPDLELCAGILDGMSRYLGGASRRGTERARAERARWPESAKAGYDLHGEIIAWLAEGSAGSK